MKYLNELIGEDYKCWNSKKVFLTAPTGMGKTTFIIETMLPYLNGRGKKMLILCNRKLLRTQYWYDLVSRYDNYVKLEKCIEIMTYQQLSENVRSGCKVDMLFNEYDCIVCDECHYFYADSDFNSFGTYALLQAVVLAGICKTVIFMSATMKEVGPLIKETVLNCAYKLSREKDPDYYSYGQIVEKDYSYLTDYSHITCYAVEDEETLCQVLAESDKKSVLFIDDKAYAERIKTSLEKTGEVSSKEIAILNAENLDSDCNRSLIEKLAIDHKVTCKILITTSVLDNGVSICDDLVGNMVIITESEISFKQMLGRFRTKDGATCNLYFKIRKSSFFLDRMNRYEEEVKKYKMLMEDDIEKNIYQYLSAVWNCSGEPNTDFLLRSLILAKKDFKFFTLESRSILQEMAIRAKFNYNEWTLVINEFARQKTGNMYITESRFYSAAVKDPIFVIHEQLKLLGKDEEDLTVISSKFREKRQEKFIQDLLAVKNYTQDQIKEFKQEIVKEYRREFFPDIPAKNGALSWEKFTEICMRYGLLCKTDTDPSNRCKLYSVEKTN